MSTPAFFMSDRNRARMRRLLRLTGSVLSILAVAWIGMHFVDGGAADLLRRLPTEDRSRLVACGIVGALAYALSNVLLAGAWWRMLSRLSPEPPRALPTMAAYAVSQYGKYLPGNVAHYALRHAWSRRSGTPHATLGLAAGLEAALLLLAALCLIVMADGSGSGVVSFLQPRTAIALLIAALVALGLALRWIRHRGGIGRLQLPPLPASALLTALLCYLVFFVCSAAIQAGLAWMLRIDVTPYAHLLAATAGSWLAGFVIIGAPAGIGVREAAFVALMGSTIGDSAALLLIGLFRAVTFVGDTAFMAAGAWLLRLDRSRMKTGMDHEN